MTREEYERNMDAIHRQMEAAEKKGPSYRWFLKELEDKARQLEAERLGLDWSRADRSKQSLLS